jgi:hypothetical protein
MTTLTPERLLEIARETGLRNFLHGVNATDARAMLAKFVDAVLSAATVKPIAPEPAHEAQACAATKDFNASEGESKYDYSKTINAIAAAVTTPYNPNTPIGISASKFWEVYGASESAAPVELSDQEILAWANQSGIVMASDRVYRIDDAPAMLVDAVRSLLHTVKAKQS